MHDLQRRKRRRREVKKLLRLLHPWLAESQDSIPDPPNFKVGVLALFLPHRLLFAGTYSGSLAFAQSIRKILFNNQKPDTCTFFPSYSSVPEASK